MADYLSTEDKQKYTHHQRRILDEFGQMGVALIKVDELERDPSMPTGGFLISYKIRTHDIEMVKLPKPKDPDDLFTLLAAHIVVRSELLAGGAAGLVETVGNA